MRRELSLVRHNWKHRCEEVGFSFHSMGGEYWDESAYYVFSADQIDQLEAVTQELNEMCIEAVKYIIKEPELLKTKFAIPEKFHRYLLQSWDRGDMSLYGRFDLSWDGHGDPKMLEYNADTPTALLEASVVQWQWLSETQSDRSIDQFNSIHEKLIARWAGLKMFSHTGALHLTAAESEEDLGTVEYLRDCAAQAGWETFTLPISEIGWNGKKFTDPEEREISTLFKLYPWEWMLKDSFAEHIMERPSGMFIEPIWKMLLSNKALLALLWDGYQGHKNLVPAYLDGPHSLNDYVKKPILSREGANVGLYKNQQLIGANEGNYGEEGYVYQALCQLPNFQGRYPVIGSWIIGEQPAGIGIREDATPITKNTSCFIPHYFL